MQFRIEIKHLAFDIGNVISSKGMLLFALAQLLLKWIGIEFSIEALNYLPILLLSFALIFKIVDLSKSSESIIWKILSGSLYSLLLFLVGFPLLLWIEAVSVDELVAPNGSKYAIIDRSVLLSTDIRIYKIHSIVRINTNLKIETNEYNPIKDNNYNINKDENGFHIIYGFEGPDDTNVVQTVILY